MKLASFVSVAIRVAAFVVSLLSHNSVANAASGTVSGTLRFVQNNGQYCDDTVVTCTGTKYPRSEFHQSQPVKNVIVYARRASDNVTLGWGYTDSAGQFSFSWTDNLSGTGNVSAQIIWRGEHRDNRFNLKNTSGGFWILWSNQTLIHGGPTPVGSPTWGTATSPNAIANLYDGASKMWENSLSQSNRMSTYFTGINITAWASSTSTNGKEVGITIDSAYSNHQAVMHEMGHSASYLASRDQNRNVGYESCYPDPGTGCGWSRHGEEWASIRFEEALATHLATVGLYFSSATSPFYCTGSAPCTNNNDNLENAVTCTTADARHPHDLMRYFWDTYDSSLGRGVWEIIDTVQAFDNGTGEKQKNEPWNSSGGRDDADGRSGTDFVGLWNFCNRSRPPLRFDAADA
ncbi:MAG: hypothetical protein RL385_1442, partial [Pseudomonadota bacterium]